MKLYSLISKLEKARASYIKKHGIEPVISSFDEYEGLILCSKVVRTGGCTFTHKKPYKTFKTVKPQR